MILKIFLLYCIREALSYMAINKIKMMTRALKHHNYRKFFIGQCISLIGTWMQRTALVWLVYRLTNSITLLGIVDFAGHIPSLFITPFAGVLLDRFNRYKIVIAAQVFAMVQAFILAYLVLTEQIVTWHIIALNFMLGLINSFDFPARQSFVVNVVDKKEDLVNAIALNSALFNSARIIGPALAGTIIALIGEGLCFLFNAISYIAVLIALLSMKIKLKKQPPVHNNIIKQLLEGLCYAYRHKPIKHLLALLALTSLMGMPINVMMPVYAKTILQGGPQTLGLLTSALGVGALCGTIYLASRQNINGLEKRIAAACAVFGTGICIFSQSRYLPLSVILIFITGFGMVAQTASTNTLIQSMVDEDKRGRVMSLYVTLFGGIIPFGSLITGCIAEKLGAPVATFIGGAACICAGLVFYIKISSWSKFLSQNLPTGVDSICQKSKEI